MRTRRTREFNKTVAMAVEIAGGVNEVASQFPCSPSAVSAWQRGTRGIGRDAARRLAELAGHRVTERQIMASVLRAKAARLIQRAETLTDAARMMERAETMASGESDGQPA